MTFALKENRQRTMPTSHSSTPLEISGCWSTQGPQVIGGKGGVPEWVDDLFQQHPKIMQIAFNYENGGVVYSRPKETIDER